MSKLPVTSGAECVKALAKIGFVVVRQRGSHIILVRDDPKTTVSVPNHDELDRGTIRAIIRQSVKVVGILTVNTEDKLVSVILGQRIWLLLVSNISIILPELQARRFA